MKRPCEKRCSGEMWCMCQRCLDCMSRHGDPKRCDHCKAMERAKACVDARKEATR